MRPSLLLSLVTQWLQDRIEAMFSAMDLDKSGDVTFMEVLQAVFPMASRQQIKVTALAVPRHSVWAA